MSRSVRDSWASVTVWVADGTLHPHADYGDALVARFEEMGKSVSKRSLETITGDEPLGSDLNVLSGGSTSVNDWSTWMPAAFKLVDRMIEEARLEKSYVLGVCLGSQIIADRLSPGSIISGERIQAGLVGSQWSSLGLSGDKVTSSFPVPSFHYEMIDPVVLSKTSEPLSVVGDNDSVSVLAYTSGSHVGATQLHPELSLGDVYAFIDFNADVINSHHSSVEEARRMTDELASHWGDDTFGRVLDILFGTSS